MANPRCPEEIYENCGWKVEAERLRVENDKLLGGHGELREENKRLRELYENVVNNRERFGWTINHLLECEDALQEVTNAYADLQEAVKRVNVDWDEVARTCGDPKCAGDCRWVEALRRHGISV